MSFRFWAYREACERHSDDCCGCDYCGYADSPWPEEEKDWDEEDD